MRFISLVEGLAHRQEQSARAAVDNLSSGAADDVDRRLPAAATSTSTVVIEPAATTSGTGSDLCSVAILSNWSLVERRPDH